MEQLVTLLSRPEILRTNRGNKGGYMLAKEPSQYTIGQILRITEGGLAPVSCMVDKPNRCERRGFCKTLPIWQELDKIINNYLDSITLEDALGYASENLKDANNSEYYI